MAISEKIQRTLTDIECEKEVTILLAVESGSRAWGFPSPDSDYDVRFLYAHDPSWYLSVRDRRDVIERPVDSVLDVSGWDIKKAFGLLTKSNGALYEWLSSPIVYRMHETAIKPIQSLAPIVFNPEAMFYHYYAMAKRKYFEIRDADDAKLKTYLYALRPILACRWILEYQVAPPMQFEQLQSRYLTEDMISTTVRSLLHEKVKSVEKQRYPKIPELDAYLALSLNELDSAVGQYKPRLDWDRIDSLFRETLDLL